MNSFVCHTFRKLQIIWEEFKCDQQEISGFNTESYLEVPKKLCQKLLLGRRPVRPEDVGGKETRIFFYTLFTILIPCH